VLDALDGPLGDEVADLRLRIFPSEPMEATPLFAAGSAQHVGFVGGRHLGLLGHSASAAST
jgi:hypothetical protein